MKKQTKIVVIAFIALAVAVGCFLIPMYTTHWVIIDDTHAYEPYSVYSFNDTYILQTLKTEDDTSVYASFNIAMSDGTIVFECPDRYRTMDLKKIDWVPGTLDIVIQSEDIGTITYPSDLWLLPAHPDINLSDYADELDSLAYYTILGMTDGSFVIGVDFTNSGDATYFQYAPPFTERKTPIYFNRLYWRDECTVSLADDVVHISVPMRANMFEDYRFLFEADISQEDTAWKLTNRELILLNDEDIKLNDNLSGYEKYGAVPIGEAAKYRGEYKDLSSIDVDDNIDDDLLKTLRTAVYGGSADALIYLYLLSKAGVDVNINRDILQLSAVKLSDNPDVREGINQNSLLKDIQYETEANYFPAMDALVEAAASVREYAEWSFRDTDSLESNIDEDRLTNISNYSEYTPGGDYPDQLWGAYELDFDGDDLMELVYFYAGGTMGNEFWDIYHLNQDGNITAHSLGMDMRSLMMREIGGRCFFTNWYYDYNDKQSIGLNLFAIEKDGTLWQGFVHRETIGMRTIFCDLYDESVSALAQTLSNRLYDFYSQYKSYNSTAIQNSIESDEDIKALFHSDALSSAYRYGFMDIDNDGAEEIIGEYKYYPSSAHQVYFYDLRAKIGTYGHTIDLARLLGCNDGLLQAFPIQYEGINYFLSMQPFGDSQYIFKLQEIRNDIPYVIAAWLVATEDQTTVTAMEYRSQN